jgi:hypothetical protein
MKIRLLIALLIGADAVLLQLNAAMALARQDLPLALQNQPRPTVPNPSSPKSHRYEPPPENTPIPPPPPTHTPTQTPTITKTLDLSFNNFYANSFTTDVFTDTPEPLNENASVQVVMTKTRQVSYSAPVHNSTPIPAVFDTIKNGVIVPVGVMVILFMGFLLIKGLLLRRL